MQWVYGLTKLVFAMTVVEDDIAIVGCLYSTFDKGPTKLGMQGWYGCEQTYCLSLSY